MIVPEELESGNTDRKTEEHAEAAVSEAEPAGLIGAGEEAAQITKPEESRTASEITTAVSTEEMSVEQAADDNHGKSEGWTAELEQPKITGAVETEVCPRQ